MHIDLRTIAIKPLRQTYDHVAARIGGDKPATRYQEGTLGVQADVNFHYRPLWDPDHEIFDVARTSIEMRDWYAFKDPRQFYYGTYTLARSRMQETTEGDFSLVEKRGLAANLPEAVRRQAIDILVPLRHVEWGGNTNCAAICAYGYGTAITQPCIYQAMDHLGMAQYLTRMGLLLGGAEVVAEAKQAWLQDHQWQPLRRYVENSFVINDWFELFVVQNLVLDGLLYPLVYQHVDAVLSAIGGPVISMLTRFQSEWYAESSKWVNATIKTATAESDQNQLKLSNWLQKYRDLAIAALLPLAAQSLGEQADVVIADLVDEFNQRAAKLGLTI